MLCGVVLSDGIFFGLCEVEVMCVVFEFVFFNCCYFVVDLYYLL